MIQHEERNESREAAHEPREEYFDNQPLGVELEEDEPDEDEQIARPWDPNAIRVSTKTFSIRQVLDQIDEEDLELAPDFQRNLVWKGPQKSRLIESIILQIPLPAFYFAEDEDGMYRAVDGLQRLSTIHSFVRNQAFALHGLEYLKTAIGQRFDDLPQAWKRRIFSSQLVVHVIDPSTPTDVKYNIFKRLNTGGSPLNAQEIRHCMSGNRSRDFLAECATLPEFEAVIGEALRSRVRMTDREMVLRFCAFRLLGVDAYEEQRYRAMEPFLDEATRRLDDPKQVPESTLKLLRHDFRQAMDNSYKIFGDHAFRKWPLGKDNLSPFNRALFESWSVALAEIDPATVSKTRGKIVERARILMSNDADYITAITTSTGDARKVRYRFRKAAESVQESR
ncbi:DUF262 domain-containing protein [Verrucosispora sp. WMMD1129]|uniref:DUF262 domain-containing protein n=1 Tax=Verrucosispora sp. WMMD1129 TaxID=3016093 RepID=UPI00249A2FE8|nr:DUF262 domain-containing protein [Verrucosispora sp. WMMD1129]WFE43329.1 DUF262 domain-containing protein [Verrucosispora sp. WMMD1129]